MKIKDVMMPLLAVGLGCLGGWAATQGRLTTLETATLNSYVVRASRLQDKAEDFAETARKAHAVYTTAQVEWQCGLAELVIENRPEFEVVARAQRDLQPAYIEIKTAQFAYLLANNPSRIVLNNGLYQFSNFSWSDEDTQTLGEADPGYAALEKKVVELRKRNDDQPDWPSFREYFRNTLAQSERYQSLFSEFRKSQETVEALLSENESGAFAK